MDSKDLKNMVLNAPPKKRKTHGAFEQRDSTPNASSGAHHRNHKEDALIDAIDMRKTLTQHAAWVEKLRAGQIDVSQFLSSISPEIAVELVHVAMNGESEKNRVAAMQDILDRAGHGKVQKHAIASIDPTSSKEQLMSLIMGMNKKSKAIEIEDDEDQEK